MQNRAKEFMPFYALKGFKDVLKKVEKIKGDKKELSEDIFSELNDKLKFLKNGDYVILEHFNDIDYIKTKGIVKKVDYTNKVIYVDNSMVCLDDIIYIDILNLHTIL